MKINDTSLRPAAIDDIDSCLEIEKVSYPRPWMRTHFEEELNKGQSTFWVITDNETDETVFAYLIFREMEEQAQVLNVAVSPKARKLGFAKTLLRKMISLSMKKETKRLFLEVRRSNESAIQLYQGLNFTIAHVRKSFYSDGEDAYVLELKPFESNEIEEERVFDDNEQE